MKATTHELVKLQRIHLCSRRIVEPLATEHRRSDFALSHFFGRNAIIYHYYYYYLLTGIRSIIFDPILRQDTYTAWYRVAVSDIAGKENHRSRETIALRKDREQALRPINLKSRILKKKLEKNVGNLSPLFKPEHIQFTRYEIIIMIATTVYI